VWIRSDSNILRHASAVLFGLGLPVLWSVSGGRADDLPPWLRVIVTCAWTCLGYQTHFR